MVSEYVPGPTSTVSPTAAESIPAWTVGASPNPSTLISQVRAWADGGQARISAPAARTIGFMGSVYPENERRQAANPRRAHPADAGVHGSTWEVHVYYYSCSYKRSRAAVGSLP